MRVPLCVVMLYCFQSCAMFAYEARVQDKSQTTDNKPLPNAKSAVYMQWQRQRVLEAEKWHKSTCCAKNSYNYARTFLTME